MKIDRLIGILTILLQKEKVTAPFLAERFEVSRRTINRDIEALCQAGIPVVTLQGVNGGIAIAEGYQIDRALLTSSDMQAIFAGLKSLDSVSGTNKYQLLMEKLFRSKPSVLADNNHIIIDLSSWYKTTLAPKIELIQEAIEKTQLITFTYFAPKGEEGRSVEPYLLIFQWASWYVWGYCRVREDYRLFKINRIEDLENTKEPFEKRQFDIPHFSTEKIFPDAFDAKVIIEPDMKWRVVEDFGIRSFVQQPDGKLSFSFGFNDKTSLFSWILSFGDKAELAEPEALRDEFYKFVSAIKKKYENI